MTSSCPLLAAWKSGVVPDSVRALGGAPALSRIEQAAACPALAALCKADQPEVSAAPTVAPQERRCLSRSVFPANRRVLQRAAAIQVGRVDVLHLHLGHGRRGRARETCGRRCSG